jgi:AcrR family transcriptional regulator
LASSAHDHGPPSSGEPGRDVILAAAQQCFFQYGYHGTSIRRIAEVAGVTSAAMYYYYESKQHLLTDLLDRFMTFALRRTREAVEKAGPTPAARLAAAVSSHVATHAEFGPGSFIVNSEIRSLDEANRHRHIEQRDQLQRIFDAAVVDGARAGDFVVDDPADASRAIVTMCTGVAGWYRPGGKSSQEQVCGRYVRYALAIVGSAR